MDKINASGGAAISSTASHVNIERNLFLNLGTNANRGNAFIATQGQDVALVRNVFSPSQETVVEVDDSTGDVTDWNVESNTWQGLARGADNNDPIYFHELNTFSMSAISFLDNTIYTSGSCEHFQSAASTGGASGLKVIRNRCHSTGAPTGTKAWQHFGFRNGVFAFNTYDEIPGAFRSDDVWALYDTFDTQHSHNVTVFDTSGVCGGLLDSSRNTFDHNECKNATGSFRIDSNSGSSSNDNILDTNTFVVSILTFPAILVSGFGTMTRNQILNTHVLGTGVQTGVDIEIGSGSTSFTTVRGSYLYNLAAGIKVGVGVIGSEVGPSTFNVVTQPWIFNALTRLNDSTPISFGSLPNNLANGSSLFFFDGKTQSGNNNTCNGGGNGAQMFRINGANKCVQ